MSLGEYNLLGALVVLAVGALVLLASRGVAHAGRVAAVLAVLGALSLHVQLGFTDPLLGGSPTSAAFLLCLAVVAVVGTVVTPRDRTIS